MKLSTWPFFDNDEIDMVSECLRSGKVNYWSGDEGRSFEKDFSKFLGVDFSIALANGTLALNCAYRALELGPGDEFITTPRTFIATSSAAVELGAKPVFADVDYSSGCIKAETIEPLITNRTKLISVVHFAGWPADMLGIMDLANQYDLKVVEDCSQAHGAMIRGKSVGSFGHISTWSFCQDKILTTGGEGGMVSTNDEKLWKKMWSYKDHGKNWDKVFNHKNKAGFRWLHDEFGSNFRLSELQSCIGRIQLRKLSQWNKIRNRNANILYKNLINIPCLRLEKPEQSYHHGFYKFYCYIKPDNLHNDCNRDKIINEINELGYPIFHGGCSEVYLEECFNRKNCSQKQRLPIAKSLGETSLMLLVHPTISSEQMNSYSQAVKSICEKYTK